VSGNYKTYDPDQLFLLPPSLKEWLPEGHLAYFVSDVVNELDLNDIEKTYSTRLQGQPPYHPAMLVKLLFYAYCMGIPSSRKIEKETHEDIAFRILAAGYHPDHDTIADFRKTHLGALKGLFLQILLLCKEANLVKLGHVALDGTKIKANASKHKAMSYGRMHEKEKELERQVEELLRKAESVDAEEDKRYGKGVRGDELPEELKFREKRLARIRQAKKALEERVAKEAEPSQKEKQPKPKDQINFTDPESRIMKDSSTKEFMQGYNAQAAVDASSQVIVAAAVTIQSNDKKQLEPMLAEVKENCNALPKELSADAGYYSEDNLAHAQANGIHTLIPPGNTRHTDVKSIPPRGRIPTQLSVKERMERLLQTKKGRKAYAKRKGTVEPVFGQIKDARGFRRFLLRGLDSVKAEWQLICLTHNLLKLYRWGLAQATA
jgi:transposase